LTSLLIDQGYKKSNSDHYLFTIHNRSSFTTLLVYVDGVILTWNTLDENVLDSKFKIKDLGHLKCFIEIEVAHSKEGITNMSKEILSWPSAWYTIDKR